MVRLLQHDQIYTVVFLLSNQTTKWSFVAQNTVTTYVTYNNFNNLASLPFKVILILLFRFDIKAVEYAHL